MPRCRLRGPLTHHRPGARPGLMTRPELLSSVAFSHRDPWSSCVSPSSPWTSDEVPSSRWWFHASWAAPWPLTSLFHQLDFHFLVFTDWKTKERGKDRASELLSPLLLHCSRNRELHRQIHRSRGYPRMLGPGSLCPIPDILGPPVGPPSTPALPAAAYGLCC